jgi:hypothetical protein
VRSLKGKLMLGTRSRFFAVIVGLGALSLLAGCGDSGDDAEAESSGFVGTVDGTDAFVSIIVTNSATANDEAIVYICDGESELREWFRGPVDDATSFQLSNDAGSVVTVESTDGSYSGEFTDVSGSMHQFDTTEAQGEAGLYAVDDEDAEAEGIWGAWVVDNDGNERGAFLRRGVFQRTPRLASATLRVSRFAVTTVKFETVDVPDAGAGELHNQVITFSSS